MTAKQKKIPFGKESNPLVIQSTRTVKTQLTTESEIIHEIETEKSKLLDKNFKALKKHKNHNILNNKMKKDIKDLLRNSLEKRYHLDIYHGFYSMIQNDSPHIQKKIKENGIIEIVCGATGIYKAAFGPLVDKNGRAFKNTKTTVYNAKKILIPLLRNYNKHHTLNHMVSLKPEQDEKARLVIGQPLFIKRIFLKQTKLWKIDSMLIEMDLLFCPGKFTAGKLRYPPKWEPYIHIIPAQTNLLQFGNTLTRRELEKIKEPSQDKDKKERSLRSLFNTTTQLDFLTAIQATYELPRQAFIKGFSRTEETKDFIILKMNQNALHTITTTSYNTTERTYWTKSVKILQTAVINIKKAIKELNFQDELLTQRKKTEPFKGQPLHAVSLINPEEITYLRKEKKIRIKLNKLKD